MYHAKNAGRNIQRGMHPACIEFEVIESAVMSDVEEAAKMLERLRREGVSIALGKKLGMTVIAEGIESQAAIKLLAGIGSDLGQGYFISKPIRADRLVEWYYQAHYKTLST